MIKEKFEELKKEKIFQDIKSKGKLGKLFLVFSLFNANLNLEQIDFSFIKNKTITCFSYKDGKWSKTETREERNIVYNKINLNVKDIEDVFSVINKLLKDKNLFANKFILILQNQSNENQSKDLVFNVTCLCKDFYVFKVTLNARSLALINKKLYNLLDFFKVDDKKI